VKENGGWRAQSVQAWAGGAGAAVGAGGGVSSSLPGVHASSWRGGAWRSLQLFADEMAPRRARASDRPGTGEGSVRLELSV
jgi:hypothetical protein